VTAVDSSTARAWRPGVWDVVLGLAVVALGAKVLAGTGGGDGFRAADPLAYALTAIGCATTVWARRQPLAALMVTGLLVTVLVARDYHADMLPFVFTGLLFMVASYRPRGAALGGLVAAALFLAASAATRPADLGLAALAQTAAVFTGAWLLGRLVRARRTTLLALVSEAEQRVAAERQLAAAERDRSRLSLVDERLRIARDVHDVLAHSMSVVSVQATVGAHLAADDPAAARQALLTISDVSRSSMQDLRQMLTLLRDDSSAAATDAVSYEPTQGLDTLEPLIATYRTAGLPVLTSVSGVRHDLSASADLCAYRIVQEALTNTLKHAAAGTATVGLHYHDSAVQVVVTDDGAGTGGAGLATGGHGLIGMRERTALLGGQLDAGPAPEGGFTVTATIPYRNEAEEGDR
jgi:signal transduction histidine kinase